MPINHHCEVTATTFATETTGTSSFDDVTVAGDLTVTGSLTASGGVSGAATQVTVADESTDTTCFPLYVTAATGDLAPKSGSNLTFNSSTGSLAATGFVGPVTGVRQVEVVTTTNAIAAGESGTTYFLNSATGFASTLPAPAAGLWYKFIVGATPPTSGNHTVVTTSNATIIQGNIATVPVDDAGYRGDDEDTITFVASTALEGDYVEVISDGTNWYVSGMANVVEAITLTDEA